MNQECITIALLCDQKYFVYTLVTLNSVITKTSNPVHAYIFHDGLDEKDIAFTNKSYLENVNVKISFVKYDKRKYEQYNQTNSIYPTTVYVKFDLPNLINEDRLIYLDSDIIVTRDILELWTLFNPEYSIMAVRNPDFPVWKDRETISLNKSKNSFNTGVIYFNAEKIRINNTTSQLYNFADHYYDRIKLPDEAAFNYVFQDDWFELPIEYNVTTLYFRRSHKILNMQKNEYNEMKKNVHIVHFTGRDKPWKIISPHPLNYLWILEYEKVFGQYKYPDMSVMNYLRKIYRKFRFMISYNNY